MLEDHPDAYDYFRAQYHDQLKKSKHLAALKAMASASKRELSRKSRRVSMGVSVGQASRLSWWQGQAGTLVLRVSG